MALRMSDRIGRVADDTASTIKSLAKCVLKSRRVKYPPTDSDSLIIMGNGPSLNETISAAADRLAASDLLAVNFAANTPVFLQFKPRYYVLADPHFFESESQNVETLKMNLQAVDWPMILFIPFGCKMSGLDNPHVTVRHFNMVAGEGFKSVKNYLFDRRMAMPRPRNVLIPSIMIAIWLGYKQIYVAGADHTWTRTLSVNDSNEVISIQPHFYQDGKVELDRTATVYKNVRIHEILQSFSIAFRAYHEIDRYARNRGVRIYNVTPGSFIDAFERATL